MADSRHIRRYGDWSKIVNDLFDEIAMRLDFTGAVRLAACSKEFYRQVAFGKGIRCPNDGCGELVAFSEFHDHKIACPHGPCTCTEPGCEFAAPPAALLAHLREAHSIEGHSFHYGEKVRYISRPMSAPGSSIGQIIGPEDDGKVFAVQFDTRNRDIVVSVVCVRSAACLSPRYKVQLAVAVGCECKKVEASAIFELTSNATPGAVVAEELRSYVSIPMIYLRGRQLWEVTLDYSFRIKKIRERLHIL